MSKAIDDLMHEHETILSALKILDTITTGIGRGSTPSRADLSNLVLFLREFADKCHHGKEEGMLLLSRKRTTCCSPWRKMRSMNPSLSDCLDHLKGMRKRLLDADATMTCYRC